LNSSTEISISFKIEAKVPIDTSLPLCIGSEVPLPSGCLK